MCFFPTKTQLQVSLNSLISLPFFRKKTRIIDLFLCILQHRFYSLLQMTKIKKKGDKKWGKRVYLWCFSPAHCQWRDQYTHRHLWRGQGIHIWWTTPIVSRSQDRWMSTPGMMREDNGISWEFFKLFKNLFI